MEGSIRTKPLPNLPQGLRLRFFDHFAAAGGVQDASFAEPEGDVRDRFAAVDGEVAVPWLVHLLAPLRPAGRRRAGRSSRAGARPCGRGRSSRCRARSSRPRGRARRGTRAPPRPDRRRGPAAASRRRARRRAPRPRPSPDSRTPSSPAPSRRDARPPSAARRGEPASPAPTTRPARRGAAPRRPSSRAQSRRGARRWPRSRSSLASHSPPTLAIQATASSSGAGLSW